MYCVYDTKNNVIAFHDDYDVVETYVNHVKKTHTGQEVIPDLHIGKIKKKKVQHLTDFDDLYLVRYADTYIQNGYFLYLELMSKQHIYDEQQCKDVLLRMLECYRLTDKERKSIEKTVKIIDKVLMESKTFTPSLEELKSCEIDYAPYMYNKFTI